jgi:hypothetical protein
MWFTATINPAIGQPDNDQATAHWFEINTEQLDSLTLEDQGNVSGEDIAIGSHTFMPSVAVNSGEEVAISFSASAPSIYPGAYYALRRPSDTPGTIGSSATVRVGLDFYERTDSGGQNRWGDYSGASVDPVDQCFWVFNQYSIQRGSGTPPEDGRWGTAHEKFCGDSIFADGFESGNTSAWSETVP